MSITFLLKSTLFLFRCVQNMKTKALKNKGSQRVVAYVDPALYQRIVENSTKEAFRTPSSWVAAHLRRTVPAS